ncbi:MAG: leucine--tRNA ligase [Gemmatimonadota bacterium]|nr:MAG: leucine--tRNA ligase [Gemmatimonadota bacterium]
MSEQKLDTAVYDPMTVEPKWRARWEERGTNSMDVAAAKKPYYQLMMFPYPSAEGLHVGNVFAFVGNDIHGRFRRLQGWDVFEPIGFDAFGIHSENYALKVNTHPGKLIPANIARFKEQLKRTGLMVNWEHVLATTDPDYYHWTQWIFLKLYEAGHAVKKQAPVNWCPECKTVLANEQVEDGYCERHPGTRVHQRYLSQWFFTITKYVERLLDNLETLDWSESTRTMQANWIGRSEGAELIFEAPAGTRIPVYTTRPDTVFGATYLVLAPEHPLVDELTASEQQNEVGKYRREAGQKDVVTRKVGDREKTGVFTGTYARNPATGESVPIWIADYVLMEYGTGAIMAVPGHDERDFEFAEKFGLEIRRVVAASSPSPSSPPDQARAEVEDDTLPYISWGGVLVNSGQFDGLGPAEGVKAITAWLEERGSGRTKVQFRLHDWCISRQRYWGPPIPMVYCDGCGTVPVPYDDLPVLLPEIDDFKPDESGMSPLARHEEWYRVPCPKCGKLARRETDVSDTFLDSAWYFLRYPSTKFDDRAFDPATTEKWLPVDSYIGGNEHAVLHLMYSRFITMVLHDLGLLNFEEPFTKFRAHGTIVKDGAKMSKSRGNVVVPDDYIDKWGADTFRMYLMFLGPYLEGGDFRDEGIAGMRRFLDRVWTLTKKMATGAGELDRGAVRKLHQTIKKVAHDIEGLHYNTAISALMEYSNTLRAIEDDEAGLSRELLEPLIVMLAPFAPHFSEECWERFGHADSVHDASWPPFDEELARADEVEVVVQVNGKVRGRLRVAPGTPEAEVVESAMADEGVSRFVTGREVRKTIYVQDRLVNIVV